MWGLEKRKQAFHIYVLQLLLIWEFRRPYKKTTGVSILCGFGKQTKLKSNSFRFIMDLFSLNRCLIYWKCGWCSFCLRSIESMLWNLWRLEQIKFWILLESQEHRTKGAQGEAKIGPRGCCPELPKSSSRTKRTTFLKVHAHCSKMGTTIWKGLICWQSFIWPVSFWVRSFDVFSDGVGIILRSFLLFTWIFRVAFEASRFV